MTADIIAFPIRRRPANDSVLGLCPMCGENDGYMNVGRVHWAVCHEDSNKWLIGENLFSTWLFETEEEREQNRRFLSSYHDVGQRRAGPKGAA